MDNKTIQRKLNQLTKIANELDHAAREKYGDEGKLFYESHGVFHVMAHDRHCIETLRQEGVRFSSNGICLAECGSW